MSAYVGRFAPSPSGPLHAGSLVAAMASYLDAKAQNGRWLVRIEDVDEARTSPGAAESILSTLRLLGMHWDGEVICQSRRKTLYRSAFERLGAHVYPCGCTRREIADSRSGIASDGAAVYPGTCRSGLASGRVARTYRLRVPGESDPQKWVRFIDRWSGARMQNLATEAGDFVLKRADGFWAYQLAVVVDDADQGISDVVRGADLIDSTARQIYLQRLLGLPQPRYMHVPVVLTAAGEKLSKQTGAPALDAGHPLKELCAAAQCLGLPPIQANSLEEFWQAATAAWGRSHLST